MARHRPRRRGAEAGREPQLQAPTARDPMILHLRHAHSAACVAIAGLRRQNCELDEDIASVLQRCVCDRLEEQPEKLEAAAASRRR